MHAPQVSSSRVFWPTSVFCILSLVVVVEESVADGNLQLLNVKPGNCLR